VKNRHEVERKKERKKTEDSGVEILTKENVPF
jgi:hypothetical protein